MIHYFDIRLIFNKLEHTYAQQKRIILALFLNLHFKILLDLD